MPKPTPVTGVNLQAGGEWPKTAIAEWSRSVVPPPTADVLIVAAVSASQVQVTVTNPGQSVGQRHIHYSAVLPLVPTTANRIATLPAGTLQFNHMGLPASTMHHYMSVATNLMGSAVGSVVSVATPSSSASVVYTDDFNRLGLLSDSPNWTVFQGDPTIWETDGAMLDRKTTSTVSGYARFNTALPADNYYSQVHIVSVQGSSSSSAGPLVRLSADNLSFIWGGILNRTNFGIVLAAPGGVRTVLAQVAVGADAPFGVYRMTTQGGLLTLSVDGLAVLSVSDSRYAGNRLAGIAVDKRIARFDNFATGTL